MNDHDHTFERINGFGKHISRCRDKELPNEGHHFSKIIKKKRKKFTHRNNLHIVNKSVENYAKPKNLQLKKHDDYLLKRRIEREIHPIRAEKRLNYWNINLKEDYNEEDYYQMAFQAQERTRKALEKEHRILETYTEKEKLKYNNEVDKMLIDSLQAKIKIINQI